MWNRSRADQEQTAGQDLGGLGVGVQVWVREQETPSGDGWVGEPTGVIVARGERGVRAVARPSDGLTTWVVAFSEPQHRRDGRGPYASATIPASLLVAAEPMA
jgi:hypothetical protein